jgi:hypothetical protein
MLAITIGITTALAGTPSMNRRIATPIRTVTAPSPRTQVASELRSRRTE